MTHPTECLGCIFFYNEFHGCFRSIESNAQARAARTVDGGAAMMMLVLMEGIEESGVDGSGVQDGEHGG